MDIHISEAEKQSSIVKTLWDDYRTDVGTYMYIVRIYVYESIYILCI